MPLCRIAGPGLKLDDDGSMSMRFGAGAGKAVAAPQLPGDIPVDTSGAHAPSAAASGSVFTWAGPSFAVGDAPLQPTNWLLDVTDVNALMQSIDSGGSSPTVTAMTEATTGRPFLRVQTADTSLHVLPLFNPITAAPLNLNLGGQGTTPFVGYQTPRVMVEARLRFGGGIPDSGGVCFNIDGASTTFYGVSKAAGAGVDHWDSCVSGTLAGATVANQLATDASFSWARLWIEVEEAVNPGTAYYYAYSADRGLGSANFLQARKAVRVTASGTAVGVFVGGHAGYMDIAALAIWRDEPLW